MPRSAEPLRPLHDPRIIRYCPPRTPQHLDGVIAPTDTVMICDAGEHLPGDGEVSWGPWEIANLVPHPARLLAAYRAPDAQVSDSPCPDLVDDPLLIWIDRGGIITAYSAPVNGCGDPQLTAAHLYLDATRISIRAVDTGAPGYRPGKG